MVEKLRFGIEAGNNITQAFAVSQLTKTERQKLIVLGKSSRRLRRRVLLNQTGKFRWVKT